MLQSIKSHKSLTLILIVFAIIFSCISLVNHYFYRTSALDLGLYNNVIFDYAHFRMNHYSMLHEFWPNPLADHFTLIPFLVSPLYWIFGSYTLLLVQITAVLFGGFGIYTYFKARVEHGFLPEIAMLHFFCLWGIYSALSFDYHDNVTGAMFVPWFLHYFDKQDKRKYLICFVIILISKENMALWASFIGLGLAFEFYKDKTKRNNALGLSVFALIYFFVIVNYVMIPLGYPAKAEQGYSHFIYSILGNNFSESVKTIVLHPVQSFLYLLYNHSGEPAYDGIKWELHTVVFLSGGFAFLFYPRFLIMLIPIYAQKLFSDDVTKWGICYHYSIEFAPMLSIALFSLISKGKGQLTVFLISGICLSLTIWTTLDKFKSRKSVAYNPLMVNFYSPNHYHSDLNVEDLNKIIETIPADAAVSASTQLVPHLAFRKKIYQFPDVKDANYILVLENGETYPVDQANFKKTVSDYASSEYWEVIYRKDSILVIRKK